MHATHGGGRRESGLPLLLRVGVGGVGLATLWEADAEAGARVFEYERWG